MNQIVNYTVHSRLTWQYFGYRVKTKKAQKIEHFIDATMAKWTSYIFRLIQALKSTWNGIHIHFTSIMWSTVKQKVGQQWILSSVHEKWTFCTTTRVNNAWISICDPTANRLHDLDDISWKGYYTLMKYCNTNFSLK